MPFFTLKHPFYYSYFIHKLEWKNNEGILNNDNECDEWIWYNYRTYMTLWLWQFRSNNMNLTPFLGFGIPTLTSFHPSARLRHHRHSLLIRTMIDFAGAGGGGTYWLGSSTPKNSRKMDVAYSLNGERGNSGSKNTKQLFAGRGDLLMRVWCPYRFRIPYPLPS